MDNNRSIFQKNSGNLYVNNSAFYLVFVCFK